MAGKNVNPGYLTPKAVQLNNKLYCGDIKIELNEVMITKLLSIKSEESFKTPLSELQASMAAGSPVRL
jgi:hypothetical protein